MSDQTMTIGHRTGDSIETDKDGKVLKVNGIEVSDAGTRGRGDTEKEQNDEEPETAVSRKARRGAKER